MKTISIEQVSNGWVVRPFSATPEWARGCGGLGEGHAVAVFNNMHELQAALPQFFEMPDPLVPVRRDQLGSFYTGPFGAAGRTGGTMSQPCAADHAFARRIAAGFTSEGGGRHRSDGRKAREDSADDAVSWLEGWDFHQILANRIADCAPLTPPP